MSVSGSVRRVLQVHTRYRQAGGEDRAVEAERVLLEDAGLDVEQVIFDNANLRESRSLAGDLRLAASAIWSPSAARRVETAARAHRADVIHVHNTFAAASPSVYAAGSALGMPVVQTLHNYRLICPAATLFRDGRQCTDCVGAPLPMPAVVHACVRGSRSQSLVAATAIGLHRRIGTFTRHVDAYIALTSFQKRMLVEGGLPADRIHVIPNFAEPDAAPGSVARSGILFVGRLSTEKGIDALLEAAALAPGLLRIAGEGPEHQPVTIAAARGDLEYLGPVTSEAVSDLMRRAVAVVVPSVCFEGFPMVVLEAYASGTPVIASRIGSLEDVVEDGVTGLHVAPGDGHDLARRLRWAVDHPDEMRALGTNARQRSELRYRGTEHLNALVEVYAAAATHTRRD